MDQSLIRVFLDDGWQHEVLVNRSTGNRVMFFTKPLSKTVSTRMRSALFGTNGHLGGEVEEVVEEAVSRMAEDEAGLA